MNNRLRIEGLSRRTLLKGAAAGSAALAVGSMAGPITANRRAMAQETTKVRLMGFASGGNAEQLALEKQLAAFKVKSPTIEVEYQAIPSEYDVRLQTDLAAGTAADVFYVNSLLAPDLMSRNVLLPIDDLMAAGGVKPEDFYPNLLKAYQYNGVTYGLPKDWSALGMFYQPQLVQESGIATPPATWDELKAAGQKLAESMGAPGIVILPDVGRYLAFHYAAGARIISDDGTQVVVDSPETRTALEYYYGLYKDGEAATASDVGVQSADVAMGQGSAAIIFEGNWAYGGFAQNFPDLEFAAAEMPAGPGGKATVAFTNSYSIFAGTEVPDAAWELVNYLTGPEGMLGWTTEFGVMPSRPALAEQWATTFPDRKLFVDSGTYALPWQFGPGGQQFFNDANAELQALFADDKSVEETAAAIAEHAANDIELGG